MTDLQTTLASDTGENGTPEASHVADSLKRALRGCTVPQGRTLAKGAKASPEEGLALVQSLLAIEDATVRQALLDAAAALSGRSGT